MQSFHSTKSKNRILVIVVALFVQLAGDTTFAIQEVDEELIAGIVAKNRDSYVGEITRENDTHVEILNLATGKNQILEKNSLASIRKKLTAQAIVEKVGLANYLAWKVSKSIATKDENINGQIAELDEDDIYINRGATAGVEVGQKLSVFRETGRITDPKTGNVIGIRKKKIADATAFEVQDDLCKIKIKNKDEKFELAIGDLIEGKLNRSIAILPLAEVGSGALKRSRLTESILTGIAQRGVDLVERAVVNKIENGLSPQNSAAFDKEKVQRIGSQLGAYAILTGSIERSRKFSTIRLRLIRAATGQMLFSTEVKSREVVTTPSVSKEALKEFVIGKFDVVWTEYPRGKSGTVVYDFLRNGTVKKAGNRIGVWEVKDDYITIRFLDAARGFVILNPQNRSVFSAVHNWKDGRKSTWIGRRK